jgi:hypothetical protein
MLVQGREESPANSSMKARAELVINAYLYKSDAAISDDDTKTLATMKSGFVIEMGDEKEYGDFAAFQKAMLSATCNVTNGENSMSITYTSGKETLEAGWSPQTDNETTLLVNGESPYPSKNVLRDTTLSRLSKRDDDLEKNGAVIKRLSPGTSPQHLLLLQTFPKQNIYVAMNPSPVYQEYAFTTPDGVKISADGKLSMGRWAVTGTSEIDIRYCAFEDDKAPPHDERATALFISGMKDNPTVTLNGTDISATLRKENNLWKIPLN